MKAAGDLVGSVVELAAGMQDRQNDLKGRDLLLGVLFYRDAATIVLDRDGAIHVHRHLDLCAEARHGLIHRVVDDLPHQMVQTSRRGGADVHAGTLTHRLETLEDLDFVSAVFVLVFCHVYPLSLREQRRRSVVIATCLF